MGRLIYGGTGGVEIEDRVLAHLRVVIMHKLRRSEPFMLDVSAQDGGGRRSFWIHPATPIQFHFYGSRRPQINREWIDAMIAATRGSDGLILSPEPSGASGSW